MNEVLEFLRNCGVYYLATVEGDQPRVRPFGTVNIFENKLYIQTGKSKNVSKQIQANPKVFAALDDIATDRHFVTIGLICEEFSGELKCMEPTKEDEWKRFDLDELPENLYSPTKHLVDYYLNDYSAE